MQEQGEEVLLVLVMEVEIYELLSHDLYMLYMKLEEEK
jgi:hypothetical protein